MTTVSLTLPVAGSTLNSVADPEIVTAFQTLQSWANGNIDGTNVAATLTGRRLLMQASLLIGSSVTAGTFFAGNADAVLSGASASRGFAWAYLDPANFAVTGKSNTQLIVRLSVAANTVAPTCNFTATLNPITFGGSAGSYAATAGTAVSGSSIAINAPSATTPAVAETSAFAFPSAGAYGLTVTTSGTTAANSATSVMMQLFALNS